MRQLDGVRSHHRDRGRGCARTDMSESDLRSVNNIPPRMMIKAGSALIVPRSATTRQDDVFTPGRQRTGGPGTEIVTRRASVRTGTSKPWLYWPGAQRSAQPNSSRLERCETERSLQGGPASRDVPASAPGISACATGTNAVPWQVVCIHPKRRGGTPSKVRRR